tara:strand:+ start:1173 stop:1739 length:567 start_codon:yes stop_codon:yes gene_type:complete
MSGMLYPDKLSTSPEPPSDASKEVSSEIATLKEKAMKCKVIALDQLNRPVLSDPSSFNARDKGKVLEVMTEWFEKDISVIDTLFNKIILEDVMDSKASYENYAVSEAIAPPLPPPIKRQDYKENEQHIAKPSDWIDKYPSEEIDPSSRSSVEIFSKNECYEATYNESTQEYDVKNGEDGNQKPIKVIC